MPDYNTPAINTLIVKSLPVDADAMLLEDSANLWQKKKVLVSNLKSAAGLGDVDGPASSVDNTIPRFHLTTGKIIQGSGVVIDDSDRITANEYDTIYIDASAMIPCTTNAALQGTKEYGTNDIDIDYFAFDAGAIKERVQFKLKMPENWNRDTIVAKFDWSSDTGSTINDTVEWGIKAGALSNNDIIDSVLGTAQVITDSLLSDNGTKLQTTDKTPPITVSGTPLIGDIIVFEIYRNTDGTDDMAEDAWLMGVTLQYLKTTVVDVW